MKVLKYFSGAFALFLFANHAAATGLPIQNATKHKIVSRVVGNATIGFKYAFVIDGKHVVSTEAAAFIGALETLGNAGQVRLKAVIDTGLFHRAPNQKATFSYNEKLCKDLLAMQVITGGKTQVYCLLNDKEYLDARYWLIDTREELIKWGGI